MFPYACIHITYTHNAQLVPFPSEGLYSDEPLESRRQTYRKKYGDEYGDEPPPDSEPSEAPEDDDDEYSPEYNEGTSIAYELVLKAYFVSIRAVR